MKTHSKFWAATVSVISCRLINLSPGVPCLLIVGEAPPWGPSRVCGGCRPETTGGVRLRGITPITPSLDFGACGVPPVLLRHTGKLEKQNVTCNLPISERWKCQLLDEERNFLCNKTRKKISDWRIIKPSSERRTMPWWDLETWDPVIDGDFLASGFLASPSAVAIFEASFVGGLGTVKSTRRLAEGRRLPRALGSWAERGPAYHGGGRTSGVSVLVATGDTSSWHLPFLSFFASDGYTVPYVGLRRNAAFRGINLGFVRRGLPGTCSGPRLRAPGACHQPVSRPVRLAPPQTAFALVLPLTLPAELSGAVSCPSPCPAPALPLHEHEP